MIPVQLESKEWAGQMLEDCIFCETPTAYWHMATNMPVCQSCAENVDESDVLRGRPMKTVRVF